MLIGVVVFLMISSITDAFSSSITLSFVRQQHHYSNHKEYRQQENIRRPLIRDVITYLPAESEFSNDGGIGNVDYNPSSSASSDDDRWSSTAAIDKESQYFYGTDSSNKNNDIVEYDFDSDYIDDGEDEDDDLYKDFENFDYTPFLEKESPSPDWKNEDKDDINTASISTSSSSSTTTAEVERVVETIAEEKTTREKVKQQQQQVRPAVAEQPVHVVPLPGFNVVLTHCTADFDSLASAVGLAKLWSSQISLGDEDDDDDDDDSGYDSCTKNFPTFVVLPRGAHPAVQRFLSLHKHLFPIRSLKSLPKDLSKLHRLALVDAQRKDRIGPAEVLLQHAKRITVVDHHMDMESDIPDITDYVVDPVGSVSTIIVERLKRQQEKQQQRRKRQQQMSSSEMVAASSPSPVTRLTEAEATLLALGIHADTGSLCFDSTTPRDASALAWVMQQGASQVAIAEHAQSSLSAEQQKVLTQALVNANSTVVHGVTVTTVLLTADGFINGLAAVAQDAMELSSADVFLLGVVYEPKSGRGGRNKKSRQPGQRVKSRLLTGKNQTSITHNPTSDYMNTLQKLRSSFDEKDLDKDGYIDRNELSAALVASGIVAIEDTIVGIMENIDSNNDGLICFEEFVTFSNDVRAASMKKNTGEKQGKQKAMSSSKVDNSSSPEISASPPSTLIIIGRAKPGVNLKSVKLGKLLEKYGGGGHPKAASATVRLNDESEATGIMSDLVDELIRTSLQEQSTVGDFMTSPVLSVRSDMTEWQVEDLFTRYDVRALPVVNEENEVIGLVTYKEVAAAKQRMWNKEQKRLREEAKKKKKQQQDDDNDDSLSDKEKKLRIQQRKIVDERQRRGPTVKAWMKQHIRTVEASLTMAEMEALLLESDIGCIPVVQDGSLYLVGMVTRTDLLRQHRYYPSLHYNNKGMSDSIAARAPIIALRKKLKQFDLDE